MKAKKNLKAGGVRLLAAALVLSAFLAGTVAMGQEKRGATVIVTLKQGSQESGELIAVKPDSILLLEPAGKDVSIDMADVRSVLVWRRSKIGQGALFGLLIGAAGGYAGGAIYAKSAGLCPGCEAPLARAGMGILGGVVGIVGGVVAGASAGRDLTVALDDQAGPSFAESLQKLRKYARVKDFR